MMHASARPSHRSVTGRFPDCIRRPMGCVMDAKTKLFLWCGVSMLTAAIAAPALAQSGPPIVLPDLYITASRLGGGITGTSTTIITAEDIERSPTQTLPDILSREAGIQAQHPVGGSQ